MIIAHKKNTAFELSFPMVDSTTPASFKTGLSPVDTAYYKDGAGAWTALAIADTAAEIGSTGVYEISLSAAEMNHDWVTVKFTAAGAADTLITFKMFAHKIDDVVDSNNRVNVGLWVDEVVTASPEGRPNVNVNWISDDDSAAVALESMFDGTGYAGGTVKLDVNVVSQNNIDFGALQKTSLNAATPASIVGNVGGNVAGSIGSLTTQAKADVNAQADLALTDYDPPTRAEATADKDAVITEVNANETKIDAVKSDTTAILADTGTDGVVVAAASKNGYALSSAGLDSIPITAPAGVASTFREMLVQLWRRLFKKSTLTATQLKTYSDADAVITTQVVSDDTVTQTQGAAT